MEQLSNDIKKNKFRFLKRPILSKISLAFFYLLLIFLFIFFVRSFIFQVFIVSSNSMEQTLFEGDIVFLSKLSYNILGIDYKKPNYGDVVVFNYNGEKLIKRIVQNNDCTNNEYYLQGDNIYNSIDSDVFGCVDISQIEGRAIFVIYSKNKGLLSWIK